VLYYKGTYGSSNPVLQLEISGEVANERNAFQRRNSANTRQPKRIERKGFQAKGEDVKWK